MILALVQIGDADRACCSQRIYRVVLRHFSNRGIADGWTILRPRDGNGQGLADSRALSIGRDNRDAVFYDLILR